MHARKALKEGYVKPTKRVFDNSKVSDHFAIIPTLQAPKSLTEIELKLYDMVVKRFLAVFYPSAEFMVTTRISTVKLPGRDAPVPDQWQGAGQPGLAGRLRQGGTGRRRQPGGGGPGEMVRTESVDVLALQTKPPARYTEATLLSAMEGAGKLIDDDELRDAMKRKGPGHAGHARADHRRPDCREVHAARGPRAGAHGQGLPADDTAARPGRRGADPARSHRQLGIPAGRDGTRPPAAPGLHGRDRADGRTHRGKAKEYDRDTIPGDYATLATPCPNCGGVVKENYRRFACTGATGVDEGCGFSMTKIPAGRAFETTEAEALLRDKKIGPLEGFRSKAGWPFAAEIKLVRDDEINNWKLEFDFGEDARQAEGDGEPVDFSGQQSLGACPKCQGHVYEHGSNYVCEHSVGATVTCDFKTGKIILQQPVPREEVHKLLATGKTSLLENFVSNKTRRKFKAYLAWDQKEGRVGFEFEPRAAKAPAKTAAKAAAKKSAAKKTAA
jgi:DNA topoisomerase-3